MLFRSTQECVPEEFFPEEFLPMTFDTRDQGCPKVDFLNVTLLSLFEVRLG